MKTKNIYLWVIEADTNYEPAVLAARVAVAVVLHVMLLAILIALSFVPWGWMGWVVVGSYILYRVTKIALRNVR